MATSTSNSDVDSTTNVENNLQTLSGISLVRSLSNSLSSLVSSLPNPNNNLDRTILPDISDIDIQISSFKLEDIYPYYDTWNKAYQAWKTKYNDKSPTVFNEFKMHTVDDNNNPINPDDVLDPMNPQIVPWKNDLFDVYCYYNRLALHYVALRQSISQIIAYINTILPYTVNNYENYNKYRELEAALEKRRCQLVEFEDSTLKLRQELGNKLSECSKRETECYQRELACKHIEELYQSKCQIITEKEQLYLEHMRLFTGKDKELEKLRDMHTQHQRDFDDIRKQYDESERNYLDLQRRYNGVQEQHEHAQKTIEEFKTEIQSIKKELSELKPKYNKLEDENKTYMYKLKELNQEVIQLKNTLHMRDTYINELKNSKKK